MNEKRTAVIILNRNLPEPTNKLCEFLDLKSKKFADIYVVEAGSDIDKISRYCSWHVDDENALNTGLRYSRGMNYALLRLWIDGLWDKYDYFFLVTNDTEFLDDDPIQKLVNIMDFHQRLGVLSPCSVRWGEYDLLRVQKTRYVWFLHCTAIIIRREFAESIINKEKPTREDFLFDGSNFRGYCSELELVAKAYANDWAVGITAEVLADENESYLIDKSELIKTEPFDENLQLYITEGKNWLRKKYGFNSRWSMQQYAKSFYDTFFKFYPKLAKYKI